MEKLKGAEANGDVTAIVQLQAAIKFNGGGHLNHSIFWKASFDTNIYVFYCYRLLRTYDVFCFTSYFQDAIVPVTAVVAGYLQLYLYYSLL